MFFKQEQIDYLNREYGIALSRKDDILIRFATLQLTSEEAKEYASHGFSRRLDTLARCIQNIYQICPLDRTELLSRDELSDICINLQSFVFNTFGCIDNLAWIYVREKQILHPKTGKPLPRSKIGFMGKDLKRKEYKYHFVRGTLSKEFILYLEGLDDWFDHLQDFRHALAHRIPLYVPPNAMTEDEVAQYNKCETEIGESLKSLNFEHYEYLKSKQEELGRIAPYMLHSYSEKSQPVIFHAQILADWNTIVELSEKFTEELLRG